MPWNGSGVFNRSNGVNTGTQVWQDDAGAGVKIRADRHDTHDQDIADGMENTVTRDGQNSPSANLPMATYRHTGVGNAVARDDYAATGQVQDGSFIWCGTAGGTADAITLTPTPAITAYAAGQTFRWIAGASPNTGAATVAISGLTTKALENDGAALAAGDHAAGKMYEGVYDGTAFQITRVRISAETPGAASTTAAGIVELATTAETETGTDATRAVTPDGLHDMTTLAGAAWFLDEDNMASNSATKTVSQQSVKAYVDTQIAAAGTVTVGSPLVMNPIATNTSAQQAHGLGAVPTFCTWRLECLTADANYSVGMVIDMGLWGTSASGNWMAPLIVDSTNITIISANASITIANRTTAALTTLTNSSWKLTITPYLVS